MSEVCGVNVLNELCMFVCVERQEDIPGPQCCHRCSSSCLRHASPPSRPENWTPWSPARGPYSNHARSTTQTKHKQPQRFSGLLMVTWSNATIQGKGWFVSDLVVLIFFLKHKANLRGRFHRKTNLNLAWGNKNYIYKKILDKQRSWWTDAEHHRCYNIVYFSTAGSM